MTTASSSGGCDAARLFLPRRPFVSVVTHMLPHDSGLERRAAWLLQAYAEAGMRAWLQAAQAVARLREVEAAAASDIGIVPTAADLDMVLRLQHYPGEPPTGGERSWAEANKAAELLLLSKCRHGLEALARDALGLGHAAATTRDLDAMIKACAEEGGRLLARTLLAHPPPPHHHHQQGMGAASMMQQLQAFVPAHHGRAEDAEEEMEDNEVEVEGDAAEALQEVLGEVHESMGGFPGLLEGGELEDAALRLPVYPFLEWARMLLAELTAGSKEEKEQQQQQDEEEAMEWEPLAHHHLHHALVDEVR